MYSTNCDVLGCETACIENERMLPQNFLGTILKENESSSNHQFSGDMLGFRGADLLFGIKFSVIIGQWTIFLPPGGKKCVAKSKAEEPAC